MKKIRETFRILGKRVEQDIDVIYPLQSQLKAIQQVVIEQQAHLDQISLFDHIIEQSLGFRLVRKYHGAIERFLPRGTSRRHRYDESRHQTIRVLKSVRHLFSGKHQSFPSTGETPIHDPTNALQMESPAKNVTNAPLISIVMPVFNTPIQYLEAAIGSVKNQSYKNWELCMCDDGSSNYETVEYLKRVLDDSDPRIHVIFSAANDGISQATNKAITLAQGDYIAFLDHDDELTPNALEEVAKVFGEHRDLDIVYSDQDKIDAGGNLSESFYKPDWSPEFFRHVMYVGHLLVLRRSLIEQTDRFNSTYDGVQDYEFMLRASEVTNRIHHIPQILYHWRKIPGSVAMTTGEKGDRIAELQAQAVNEHLKRMGIPATANIHPAHPHRVVTTPLPRKINPLVSIVIPVQNHSSTVERCIDSITRHSTYANFEIVIVAHESMQLLDLAFENSNIKKISTKEPYNPSQQLNIGIEHASGNVLVTLSGQIKILSVDWLQALLFHLDFPDVGAVSPLILDPEGKVYHAGMVLGLRGVADHLMRGYAQGQDGYSGSLSSPREVSAVKIDGMMFRRMDFQDLGGFNEYFSTGYYDLDFCLRLRKRGKRIVCVPDVTLVKDEVVHDNLDAALFVDRWHEWIEFWRSLLQPKFLPHFKRLRVGISGSRHAYIICRL